MRFNKSSVVKSSLAFVTVALAVAAPSVFAQTASAVETAITTAQADGKSAIELTTTGMIQIVAVVVGIGLIIGLLKRV